MQHLDWINWILKTVRMGHSLSSEDLSTRSQRLSQRWVLVGLILLCWGYSPVARADVGDRAGELLVAASPEPANPERLAIPASAAEVPASAADSSWENLPPPEPIDAIASAPASAEISPEASPEMTLEAISEGAPEAIPEAAPVAVSLLQSIKAETAAKPVELAFNLPPQDAPPPQTAVPTSSPESADLAVNAAPLAHLFAGNSDSLVAKAVGSAEGTRTPKGDRNPAYFGHVDPGNKAWNLGSFSYQHEAATPEDADAKQLNRLQDQASIMQAKAQAKGLSLTLEEALNGIDLANQAPKAVLDQDGYIDWLEKAHQNGLSGDDAVLWARTQSFFDPNLQRWNAPGLGNTQESISRDQERRMQAIDRAIAVHELPPAPAAAQPASQATASASPQTVAQTVPQARPQKISEDIGIARLFAEQTIAHFGGSASSPVAAAEKTQASSQPAPKLTAAAPETQTSTALAEPPGLAALFSLDLPRS